MDSSRTDTVLYLDYWCLCSGTHFLDYMKMNMNKWKLFTIFAMVLPPSAFT